MYVLLEYKYIYFIYVVIIEYGHTLRRARHSVAITHIARSTSSSSNNINNNTIIIIIIAVVVFVIVVVVVVVVAVVIIIARGSLTPSVCLCLYVALLIIISL